MAIAPVATIPSQNFETYALVWLDANVHTTEENINAQGVQRSCVNHLQLFDDSQPCEEYIRSVREEERIILIISGRFSQELIAKVHDLSQIYTIYIYCMNDTKYKEWIERFHKVRTCSPVQNSTGEMIISLFYFSHRAFAEDICIILG